MKLFIAVLILGLFYTPVQSTLTRSPYKGAHKLVEGSPVTQTKRDLSLSYAATDIDSKKGTRVKTITVIKSLGDKNKNQPLAINPELHKNEEWATAFRDNFDSFGKLPDVPNIDELFEFMHKKNVKEKGVATKKPSSSTVTTINPSSSAPTKPTMNEKPVTEEVIDTSIEEGPVEKIKGDAEILPPNSSKRSSNQNTTAKSQSLTVEKYQVHEPLVDLNYSASRNPVHQYFENYVQQNSNSYDYAKPCPHHADPQGSITVTTPAGRSYDIPINKNNIGGGGKPYIAPAITKKPQIQQTQGDNLPANTPTYPVNSLLPPQNQRPNVGSGSVNAVPPVNNLQPPLGVRFTTTQPAYVAPSLRNMGLESTNLYSYRSNFGSNNYNTNAFQVGGNRFNNGRSRGLKY